MGKKKSTIYSFTPLKRIEYLKEKLTKYGNNVINEDNRWVLTEVLFETLHKLPRRLNWTFTSPNRLHTRRTDNDSISQGTQG